MFNLFEKVNQQWELISASNRGFVAGLSAGVSMVQIAAERARSAQNDNISLDDIADIMQQTLDEFVEAHASELK